MNRAAGKPRPSITQRASISLPSSSVAPSGLTSRAPRPRSALSPSARDNARSKPSEVTE